jgi:hypothetical protein
MHNPVANEGSGHRPRSPSARLASIFRRRLATGIEPSDPAMPAFAPPVHIFRPQPLRIDCAAIPDKPNPHVKLLLDAFGGDCPEKFQALFKVGNDQILRPVDP